MAQVWNQREDGECAIIAMGESYHVDLSEAMDLTEANGALLMELMEDDLPPSDMADGDADWRLSHVIRSLEAEIGSGGDVAVRTADGESVAGESSEDCGGRLQDMLLDLDDHYELGGSFGYFWPELSLMGHETTEGWYVYSNGYEGGIVGYEAIDHQYNCCVEGSVEQLYSPLWG